MYIVWSEEYCQSWKLSPFMLLRPPFNCKPAFLLDFRVTVVTKRQALLPSTVEYHLIYLAFLPGWYVALRDGGYLLARGLLMVSSTRESEKRNAGKQKLSKLYCMFRQPLLHISNDLLLGIEDKLMGLL